VTAARPAESLWVAYGSAVAELGGKETSAVVLEAGSSEASAGHLFRERFPSRYFEVEAVGSVVVAKASDHARAGHSVYVNTSASVIVGGAYQSVRDALCSPRANVKIFADPGGPGDAIAPEAPLFLEDVGIMRGLPAMAVIVPADAPSTRSVVNALGAHAGPAYVRLSRGKLPTVTDGAFELGRAAERRSGGDLTIVAVGALVGRALDVAEELAKVGVSTRVLDFASVKPFDEPALLRAARDTGAILVLEEHSVLTGVGALVASTTAENYPVPVRRVGVPDLFVASGEPSDRFERYGLGMGRIRDEAWELLRLRGKVT